MYQYASDEVSYPKYYNYIVHLIVHSIQVESSVSAGGKYLGFSGSFSVDINKFSAKASSSSKFGSQMSSIASGPSIQQDNDGMYKTVAQDKTSPIPIHFKLKPITEVFHRAYWRHLKIGMGTYDSIQVGNKLKNVERVLKQYPKLLQVEKSSGKLMAPVYKMQY